MSFVHLRVHSEYSFLRGACRLEALVLRAKELGMPAVALTDYGVLHGAFRFTELALKHGVQPVLGMECTFSCGLPVVFLARDRVGWGNLLRLTNRLQLSLSKKSLRIADIATCAPGLTAILLTGGEGVPQESSRCIPLVERALSELKACFEQELDRKSVV